MKISHPFVIEILNKQDLHPLQAASNHSGERMVEVQLLEGNYDYTPPKREAVVALSDLILPPKDTIQYLNLPDFLQIRKGARSEVIRNTRNTLWMTVAWREKRANAQFSRQFQLALPPEIALDKAHAALSTFAESALVQDGMIADLAIHETRIPREGDSHEVLSRVGYLMCTTRPFDGGHFANKNRQWNDRGQMLAWRKQWFENLKAFLPPSDSPNLSQASGDLIRFANRFGGGLPLSMPEPSTKTSTLTSDIEIAPADEPIRPVPSAGRKRL